MKRRNRGKRRIAKAGAVLILLLLLVAAGFLFQVKKIAVFGNSRHSAKEISGGISYDFLTGNTLYLLWKHRDGAIPEKLPFLSSLHVEMKSPSSIEVHVTEKRLAGYIDKNGYVCFDEDGTVLEISEEPCDGIPLVTGVATGDVVLYQKLPTESSAQLRTILSLTELLSYHELEASEIRFGDNMEITVFIDDVEVSLGQDEYLEEKIANLSKIMPRLDGEYGELHLETFTGRNETVSFMPSDSPQTDAADEGAADDDAQGNAGDGAADGTIDGAGDGVDGGATDDSGDAAADDTADGSTLEGSGDTAADGTADEDTDDADVGTVYPMVFDSSGTLVYNVHVKDGVVVDANGNPVSGVVVNENGNVQDAYMNEFDSQTGELIQ